MKQNEIANIQLIFFKHQEKEIKTKREETRKILGTLYI